MGLKPLLVKILIADMKVLIVTGKLAAERALAIAKRFSAKVHITSEEVASLLTPRKIAKSLGRVRDAEMVLVPGLIKGDVAEVARVTGVPVYKGTRDIADLEILLKNLDNIELSTTTPADALLEDMVIAQALRELKRVDSAKVKEKLLKRRGNMLIGSLTVGRDFPMRVLAEIVGIEHLSDEEILRRANYFKRSGADIIDLGIMEFSPQRVAEVIELLKPLGVPLSIDTMEPENIASAIDAGADLILSFDHELLKEFSGIETPSVIIPRRGGEVPKRAEQRVRLLEENIALAEEQGFKKIIADPLLSPLNFGFTESVEAYRRFGERHPERVMLFGLGNVSELLDADSTGVNAVLAGIASEVGASILFTPEASAKTKGSVRELSVAAKMMFLAKQRGAMPKDLGLSLLVCKEKRIRREPLPEEVKRAKAVKAEQSTSHAWDSKGYFKIYVDDAMIYCAHFRDGKLNHVVTGESAKDIGDTLLRLGLIGELSHALYLGRELQRAEDALRLGKSYVQR